MIYSGLGRVGPILALGWVLAAACSSQEQPSQPTNVSGNSVDSGIAVDDAGSAISDASICDPVAARLLPHGDDAALDACSFALTIPSNGYDAIRVFENGALTMQIPADSINGWTYSDASTILLTGSYCDDALAGKIVALYVIFACPGHPIP